MNLVFNFLGVSVADSYSVNLLLVMIYNLLLLYFYWDIAKFILRSVLNRITGRKKVY